MVTDDEGNVSTPPDIRHFVIPRKDYEIIEGSWNVMGLGGTGSKDVKMTDVFIPDYRVVEAMKMIEGEYYADRQPGHPLYGLSFGVLFASAIALRHARHRPRRARRLPGLHAQPRVGRRCRRQGRPVPAGGPCRGRGRLRRGRPRHRRRRSPTSTPQVIGRAALTTEQRLEYRRDQVRAVNRVDRLGRQGVQPRGASASGVDRQAAASSYWRDLHAGGSHICNIHDTAYTSWAQPRVRDRWSRQHDALTQARIHARAWRRRPTAAPCADRPRRRRDEG